MIMTTAFESGNVVELKSGGPLMTVIFGNISTNGEPPAVLVSWFDDEAHEHRNHFPPECLDLCELVMAKNPLEYAG